MKTKFLPIMLVLLVASVVRAEPPTRSTSVLTPNLNPGGFKKMLPSASRAIPPVNRNQQAIAGGGNERTASGFSEAAKMILKQPKNVAPALQTIPRTAANGAKSPGGGAQPQISGSGERGSGAARLPQGPGTRAVTPNGISGERASQFEGVDIARRLRGVDVRGDAARPDSGGLLPGVDKPEDAVPPGLGERSEGSKFERQLEGITGLTGKSNRERMSETSQGFLNGVVSDSSMQLSNARAGRVMKGDNSPNTNHRDWDTSFHSDGTATATQKTHNEQGEVVTERRSTTDGSGEVTRFKEQVHGPGWTETHTATRNADGSYSHSTSRQGAGDSGVLGRTWTSDSPVRSVDPDSPHGGSSFETLPLHRAKDPVIVTGANAGTPNAGTSGGRPPGSDASAPAPRLNVDVDLTGQPNPDGTGGGGGTNFMERPETGREVNPGPSIPR